MNFAAIELPSNRKFGLFFSAVFVILGARFFMTDSTTTSYVFFALGLLCVITTLIKPDMLLPLNKLWMRFGLLLGTIVSPIVLGIIFFGLFTPISLLMRLFGRDELRLKSKNNASHWIRRESEVTQTDAFKHQF